MVVVETIMEGKTRSIGSGLRAIARGIFAGSLVVITAAIVASLNPRAWVARPLGTGLAP